MSEALAKRGPTDLVPAFLLDTPEDVKSASIAFGSEDLPMARLSICQDLTPHRKKNVMGQPNEKYIAGLEPGQLFIGSSKRIVGDAARFVVLHFWRSNRWFDDGKIKCRAEEGVGCSLNGGKACCNNSWDNTKSGKEAKPKCTEYMNYAIRLLESGEYAVLSFKSTGLKVAKEQLNGQLKDSVQPGVALYRKVFEISSKPDKNSADQEFFLPVVRRPIMTIDIEGGGKQEMGEVVTDKALMDALKKQRAEFRGRTRPIKVEEDIVEGEKVEDDIPF